MKLLTFTLLASLFIPLNVSAGLVDFPKYQGIHNNKPNKYKPKSNRLAKLSSYSHSMRIHYIDNLLVKRKQFYDNAMKAANEACKNGVIDFDCKLNHMNKFNETMPNRGTAAFVNKHYGKFTKEQALKKRSQLVNMLTKVHFVALPENKGIELTVDMVKRELLHLEANVLKISPNKY